MARRDDRHHTNLPDEPAAAARAGEGAARLDDATAARIHDETQQGLAEAARTLAENGARLQDSERALRDREDALTRTGEMARALAERTEELRARTARSAELARRLPARPVDDPGVGDEPA